MDACAPQLAPAHKRYCFASSLPRACVRKVSRPAPCKNLLSPAAPLSKPDAHCSTTSVCNTASPRVGITTLLPALAPSANSLLHSPSGHSGPVVIRAPHRSDIESICRARAHPHRLIRACSLRVIFSAMLSCIAARESPCAGTLCPWLSQVRPPCAFHRPGDPHPQNNDRRFAPSSMKCSLCVAALLFRIALPTSVEPVNAILFDVRMLHQCYRRCGRRP